MPLGQRSHSRSRRSGHHQKRQLPGGGPTIEHAVELLGGRDDIAYGFHVCLNSEWECVKWKPLTHPYSLTDKEGQFLPHPLTTKRQMEQIIAEMAEVKSDFQDGEKWDVWREVDDELLWQWQTLKKLGLPISYIDEHMGVGRTIPYVRVYISRFCQLNGVVDAHTVPFLPPINSIDSALADFQSRLEQAEGDEYAWVTHPGKVAPDMNEFFLAGGEPGVVSRERDAERRLLTDLRLPELLRELKVQPTRYDELSRG